MVNIFVGNLAYTLSEDELRQAFEKFGTVDRVNPRERFIQQHELRLGDQRPCNFHASPLAA